MPEALRIQAHDNFGGCTIALDKRSAKSFIRINDRIRAREIRVIDENGEQMGILAPFEALKIARERGLDLVEVSPNAVPPVCRIQDYGRFLYEKEKSERAAKKKQKIIVVKEVKFSVTVDEHDYQTKKNQAVKFLQAATRSRPVSVSAAARWPIATSATTSSTALSRTSATMALSSSCRAWKAPSCTRSSRPASARRPEAQAARAAAAAAAASASTSASAVRPDSN